jgi:GST-like protein
MFGQLGFFVKFAGAQSRTRAAREIHQRGARLLAVVEGALEGQDWIAGDYSIADIALGPWLAGLEYYEALEAVGWHDLNNTPRYVERFLNAPAVQKGRNTPPREG